MTYFLIQSKISGNFATLDLEEGLDEGIQFTWTEAKGDAVRFASRYHARAIAKRLKAAVVRVKG